MDIDVLEAGWCLGLIGPEQLPDVAIDLLQAGVENNDVLILSALAPEDSVLAVSLFDKILRELGRGNLPKVEAALVYAKYISRRILSNEIDAIDGAKMIWRAYRNAADSGIYDLDPFVYAASEAEARVADREFFNGEIKKQAERLVGNK